MRRRHLRRGSRRPRGDGHRELGSRPRGRPWPRSVDEEPRFPQQASFLAAGLVCHRSPPPGCDPRTHGGTGGNLPRQPPSRNNGRVTARAVAVARMTAPARGHASTLPRRAACRDGPTAWAVQAALPGGPPARVVQRLRPCGPYPLGAAYSAAAIAAPSARLPKISGPLVTGRPGSAIEQLGGHVGDPPT